MKKLFSIVSVVLTMWAGMANAQTARTVTINVQGSRYKQIAVDNQNYAINTTSATGEQAVEISNLANGQHSLQLYRNYNSSTTATTNFTLREGYDMVITVGSFGNVSLAEIRSKTTGWNNGNWNNGANGGAISNNQFTKLYNNAKAKSSSSARSTYLQTEFNSNRRYTSAQASQMISLVNSESSRFTLAKLVYTDITDRENFSKVSNLLYSSNNKTQLNNYIASVPVNNSTTDSNSAFIAMDATKFNDIYSELSAESVNDRGFYLQNFFSKDYNYYTSNQVKQLLQLLPNEVDRLAMAKAGYRGITDRESYYNTISPLLYSNVNRNELKTYISNNGTTINNGTTTIPNPTLGVAMNSTDFNSLYSTINNSWNSSTKYSQVATALQGTTNYFSISQVRQLLLLVSGESDRLALAKLAYDNITDTYNYNALGDVFSNYDNKTEWSRYVTDIQNGGTGVTYRVAMTDSEFQSTLRTLQFSFGLGAKYSTLQDIFNKETNYFTSAQIKQLIQQVSNESNRLELAKLAYNNSTDPTSYSSTLYDVFSSQSSRDQLSSYISVNPYR